MKTPALLPALLVVLVAAPAAAEPGVDVEIDPIAYALDGYSLHAGVTHDRLRIDLGAFAIAVPEAVHGNDGFRASFDGFGAKAQYFVLRPQAGPFVGAGAGVARLLVERDGTQLAERTTGLSAGVHVGWRFELPHDFYATPWIGVDYTLTGADDVMLDGATFERSAWSVFPTVHLGRRFE
jgi:hypothetical protein